MASPFFKHSIRNPEEQYSRLSALPKLFYEGDLSLLTNDYARISVVGSKSCSIQGRETARIVARKLSERGIVTVSGLVEGIDAAVHESTVKSGGRTIAVMLKSLHKALYPLHLHPIQTKIRQNHLMITEFGPKSNTEHCAFESRNKIMARISDATFIIEAIIDSWTVTQAIESQKLGKPVYLGTQVMNSGYEWSENLIDNGAKPLITVDQALSDFTS